MKSVLKGICLLLFLTGCGGNSTEKEIRSPEVLNSCAVDNAGLFIARGGTMIVMQDHLIGLDHGFDDFFYDINLRSLNEFMRFGKKGLGPGEFVHPFTIQCITPDLFAVYDGTTKKYSYIRYPEKEVTGAVEVDHYSFHILQTKYGQYVGLGAYREGMFCLFDSTGNKTGYFYQYPYRDEEERQTGNHLRGMAYQGCIVMNPAKDRFVYACSKGDIIHFYDVRENSIDLITNYDILYPEYIVAEANGGFGAPMKRETVIGYVSVTASDEFVYALYSGRTLEECLTAVGIDSEGDLLTIYTWEGEEVNRYKLDFPCQHICIHPNGKELWGIRNNPDPELVVFDVD